METDEREDDLKDPENAEEIDDSADAPKKERPEQEAQKRYEELEDRYMRLQADYSNFRRRSGEEKSRMHALGLEKLALDILPVLDNFERALSTSEVQDQKFYEGMEMIADQFRKELAKNGIVEIDALNRAFDPNLHHAVMIEEKEGVDPDIVIDVLQKGYQIDERVIRPAMVKVSK